MDVFNTKDYALTSNGAICLIFFTVLSNIFAGITSLIYFVFKILNYFKGIKIKRWSFILEFISTISVFITFFVVVFFLAPIDVIFEHESYFSMFYGPNFFFHFVIPVFCIFNFIFLEHCDSINYKFVYLDLIPVVLYGTFYYINFKTELIKIEGGEGKLTSDWYHFLSNGNPIQVVLIALLFIGCTIGFGYIFLFLNKKTYKKESK